MKGINTSSLQVSSFGRLWNAFAMQHVYSHELFQSIGRWEVYDPRKEYGKYTIGGGIVNKKET